MTANPLTIAQHSGGKFGLERLRDYCDWLNRQPWVKAPYFIAEKPNSNGSIDYRLAQ